MRRNTIPPATKKLMRQSNVTIVYARRGAISSEPTPLPERAIAIASPLLLVNHLIIVEVNGIQMVLVPAPARTP
jgi:hypothetical protein